MLNWCSIEFFTQGLQHNFTCAAVVRENTDFDQAMGIQRCIGFFFDGRGQSIATDHHDRIEMVSVGALFFALGRSQMNQGHGAIIG